MTMYNLKDVGDGGVFSCIIEKCERIFGMFRCILVFQLGQFECFSFQKLFFYNLVML
jgi:hypothetical protein